MGNGVGINKSFDRVFFRANFKDLDALTLDNEKKKKQSFKEITLSFVWGNVPISHTVLGIPPTFISNQPRLSYV